MAMATTTNTQLILSLQPRYPSFTFLAATSTSLPFSLVRFPSLPLSLKFRASFSFKSPTSTLRSFSDAEEDEEEYDDEDEEDDDEEEEDVAADEYDDVSGEISDEGETLEADALARYDGFKWQRVEKLCNEVREFGAEIIDVDELASVYDFRIDKFQRQAIQAFLRGSSAVVSAPTSSGKTLIAEAAAVATVARGRRIFYTTPLKALSNQKFREFRETFGDSNVGLLTGDSAVNKDAQVLIMTTEILRNMLYQSVGNVSSGSGLVDVDVIVLDEVHYLSDISRGTVWEEIVIYCPKEVQLICLSATVANPDELAGWIGQIHGETELVTSSKRPVPLTWHFSMKNSLLPLLNEKGTHMNRKLSLNYLQLQAAGAKPYKDDWSKKRNSRRRGTYTSYDSDDSMFEQRSLSKNNINAIRRSQVPQIIDTLLQLQYRDMLPAIWFIFSRKGCDAAVQYVENCKLLDECETSEVELALKRFRMQYPDAVRETAVRGLLQGVAAHHAGCLPLWKAFIEELFQRGLVKVVFATETLAAGINMPARTAVISSLSKRGDTGRISLSSNELLQMAGRAGRRGIDESGHVVLIQTPNEGAEECCKVLFAGLEPLVSQFTASYGMVLNLLAGVKAIHRSNESDDTRPSTGRTLEEARKLVEQSFGNYVSSNVMLAAKEELNKIEKEIELLMLEISDEAIDRKSRKALSQRQYKEIAELQEDLRAEKRVRSELRKQMEAKRISALKPLLEEPESGHLPYLCLQYRDSEGVQHPIPAVFLGKVDSLNASKLKNMITSVDSFALNLANAEPSATDSELKEDLEPSYHVALGSDNSWYLFTEKWIKTVYGTGFPNVPLAQGDARPREIMSELLDKEDMKWDKLAHSEHGGLWFTDGSLETWSWSLNVPVLSSLLENDELLLKSQPYKDAIERYKEQRNKVARLKKRIARTEGYKEYNKIIDAVKFTEEKIKRLKNRSERLINRIEQIEPSGWKEFMQVSNVIHETRALDINSHVIFPLGETAAAIRGENELWLAMVLRNKILLELKPAQLAAVCASLVSEGIKVRPWKNNSYIYEPSATVVNFIRLLDEQRSALLAIQDKHGVTISCCLDTQFCGMVEAWASGLTWREIMMDCAMDDGDLARLLRRTIDLLVQVPKLPDIDPLLQRNAKAASDIMDRPPISELAG
ncbi:DExH-box ATP-dependent RNA helicase DExH15 chloroplastic isoform X1 [Abrus precatorius]|uniref:DExH-box ATP-dependent RNA helicase DExH15 chloroplastic isoform X1 n=1 Tax=Abrus precatorius TaxID=3816 RepID=A0A8B8LXV4_ABRPR|nr:DExH-box ATP-dependent RNA helicase DExH15 chloroplastic isoform X1 [Abrus precatorius]